MRSTIKEDEVLLKNIIGGNRMKKTKILTMIMTIFLLSLTLIGCNNIQQSEVNDLRQEIGNLEIVISDLETKLLVQEELIKDNNTLYEKIDVLETQAEDIRNQISTLEKSITLNNSYEDLTDLNAYEYSKFNEFKLNYDDRVLLDLEPLSICKMYLYASCIKDFATSYELHTTNKDGLFWSKEEEMNIPLKDRRSDFKIFEDIYGLKVEIRGDNEENAIISWFSKNGYYDESIGANKYCFRLEKDEENWRVPFLPMQ